MTRRTWRRRKIKVFSPYGYDEGKGYDTKLELYPTHICLRQDRSYNAGNRAITLNEMVVLDPSAIELLIKLWQEVKGAITPK